MGSHGDAFDQAADALPPVPEGDSMNILWAADVWYSIKKHWVLEAQRFLRAKNAAGGRQ